jgi:serine/threonine protein kinase
MNRIHEGVYGVVYRAEDIVNREVVAIKKLKLTEGNDFPITSLREIAILKSVQHDNIIKIKKVSSNATRTKVYIIMEYMDH